MNSSIYSFSTLCSPELSKTGYLELCVCLVKNLGASLCIEMLSERNFFSSNGCFTGDMQLVVADPTNNGAHGRHSIYESLETGQSRKCEKVLVTISTYEAMHW